jgi:hypothetical protein
MAHTEVFICPGCNQRPGTMTLKEWDYCEVCRVPERGKKVKGQVLNTREVAMVARYRQIWPWIRGREDGP